jgi:hypothetical protein
MAQTKRRRRSKHRGTPAGTIEARGRTGRKPTAAERGDKPTARPHRLDKPPTWQGAAGRAAIATVIFLIAVLLLGVGAFRQNLGAAIVIAVFMFFVYWPLGFYTDRWMYRRRQRQKAAGAAAGTRAPAAGNAPAAPNAPAAGSAPAGSAPDDVKAPDDVPTRDDGKAPGDVPARDDGKAP